MVLVGHILSVSGYNVPVFIQNVGVMLFFILSGFLITYSSMRKENYTATEYLIDRASRIFVPYVPALLFIAAAGIIFKLSGPIDIGTFISNAVMLQDFPLHRYIPFPEFERLGTGRVLWSVAVEWWFYIAFGVLFFWGRLSYVIIALCVPAIIVVVYNATLGFLFFTWCFGAVLAVLADRKFPWAIVFLLTTPLAIYRLAIVGGGIYDLHLQLLCSVSMISFVVIIKNVQLPRWSLNISKWIASYSFSLYLVHYTIMEIFISHPMGGLITFFVSNAVAILMYAIFERHHRAFSAWVKRRVIGVTSSI